MKKLYMVGGTMGVGKTTVCQILKRDLPNSVFLDGDWCWDSSPFQVTEETKEMVMGNICCLLNSFLRCTAYENIIFCWVMYEQRIIDAITESLASRDCEIYKLSLVASEECLRERLHRDVESGARTDGVIERSVERIALYDGLDTIKVDTSYKTARQVADEIKAITQK